MTRTKDAVLKPWFYSATHFLYASYMA